MKSRDLIKKLEADGWYFKNTRGSHTHSLHPIKKGEDHHTAS